MKYIGCDAHITSCSFHVVDEKGVTLDSRRIMTNGTLLVDYVRGIPGEKMLVVEETNLSRWLYGMLRDEVSKMVVCNPVHNRLLETGPKNDRTDSYKLAELLRGGFIKEVFHQADSREDLRDLVSGYSDLIGDFVRLKNRYKALFRSEGLNKRGTLVYRDESFLKELERGPKRFVGENVYERIVVLESQRVQFVKEMERQAKKYPELRLLKTIPGIGTIHACKIVSVVVTPERFANKYKFFSYCGLVNHRRESDGQYYGQRQAQGNRTLKGVFKMAGHTVLQGTSSLRRDYDRMLTKGVNHEAAYNAVCRKIAAIVLAVWKKKEKYDDRYQENLKRRAKTNQP
jgi:transposase